ncbi:MAG: hypothetical protein RBS73_13425 [Prolixibacteraceae bacterium]|nr:hypothetical protein [Prolixibacteraceae bacterium]
MKKLFLVTMMFLSVVTFAQTQRGSGQRPSQSGGGQRPQMDPEQMVQRQVDRLNEAVTLTDAQKTNAKEIFKKSSEKRRELFQGMRDSGGQPDREKMRASMDELRKKETAEIKAILTPEQLPKYETYLKEMEQRMRERMNNGPGGGNR